MLQLFRESARRAAGQRLAVLICTSMVNCAAAAELENPSALTLAAAEQLLLDNGPDLQAARLALEGAQADIVTAREPPNPQLSINSSSVNFHDGLGSGAPWNKQVDSVARVDQLFERGGKRSLREQVAHAGQLAASESLANVLRVSQLTTAQAYYDLKNAQDSLQIAQRLLTLQQQSLDAAKLRLDKGDVAALEAARLEIETARAEATVADAQKNRREAQIALAQTLGFKGDSTALTAIDEWPELAPLQPSRGAADERADVRAAQAAVRQSEIATALARAQRTHDITVGVQYERYPQPQTGPNSWGVGFSVPLFLRHRYEGEIQRAAVDRRLAEQNLQRTRQDANADQEQAQAELDAAVAQLRRFQESLLKQAGIAATATEYAYSRGALGLTDLLDARRSLQAVLLDALNARTAFAKALVHWRAANTSNASANQ